MRLYRLGKLGSLDALQLQESDIPRPGPGQVTVRIRAASLNHRDLNIVAGGNTSVPLKPHAIPLSDGAGEVSEVGPGVTRWQVGERVAPIFVQRWIGGELLPEYMPSALGGPGTLANSIAAIRYCGHISVVGTLGGKAMIDPATLFAKRASMCGIQVGSRDMFEAMVLAMEVAKLEPVIDRVFGFEEARAAYQHLASGRHFGKVVVGV